MIEDIANQWTGGRDSAYAVVDCVFMRGRASVPHCVVDPNRPPMFAELATTKLRA